MDNILEDTITITSSITETTSNIFADYKVKATCSKYNEIEHFNVYDLELAPGCKIRSIEGLSDELQLRLKYKSKPVFIIDDGKIKMIFANDPKKIYLSDLLEKKQKFTPTEIVCGIDYNGEIVSAPISQMPHMLVAGTTGSGKSVFLHTIIGNFLQTYRPVDFYLFDPKYVEFEYYKGMKPDNGSLIYVHNTFEEIIDKLKLITMIMEKRFELLCKYNCKNINEFNKKMQAHMKYIFVIVDEFADLVSKDKGHKKIFENMVCAITSKSRASGLHLIVATQRPSIQNITGNIKANFPTRVCFKVATGTDSRIVLDQMGGENLISGGDAIMINNGHTTRFQAAYTSV